MKNLWRIKKKLLADGYTVNTKLKDFEGKEVIILGADWTKDAPNGAFKKIKGTLSSASKGIVKIGDSEYVCYGSEVFVK